MRFWPRFGFTDEQKTKESEYDRPELWRRRLMKYALEIIPIMLFEMLVVGRWLPLFVGLIALALGTLCANKTPYKELFWLAAMWTAMLVAFLAVDAWWPVQWYLRVIDDQIVMGIVRPLFRLRWDWTAKFPLQLDTPLALIRMSNFWFAVRVVLAVAPLGWVYPTMLSMMRGFMEIRHPKEPELMYQPVRVRRVNTWGLTPEIVDEGEDEEEEEDRPPVYRVATVLPSEGGGYHRQIVDFDMGVLKNKTEPAIAATRRLASLVAGFIETDGRDRAPWSKNYWTGRREDGKAVFTSHLWEAFAKYMLEKGWAEKISQTETDITDDGLQMLLKVWEQEKEHFTEELEGDDYL